MKPKASVQDDERYTEAVFSARNECVSYSGPNFRTAALVSPVIEVWLGSKMVGWVDTDGRWFKDDDALAN